MRGKFVLLYMAAICTAICSEVFSQGNCFISGSNLNCPNSAATYTLEYTPGSGQTVAWQAQGGSIQYQSPEQAVVLWAGGNPNAFVKATVLSSTGAIVSMCMLEVVVCGDPRIPPLSIPKAPGHHCVGSSYTFHAQTGQQFQTFDWEVSGAAATAEVLANMLKVVFHEPGTVTIRVTAVDIFGCVFTAATEVNVVELAPPSFVPAGFVVNSGLIEVCRGQEVFFGNTSDLGSSSEGQFVLWQWTVSGNGQDLSFYNTQDLTYTFRDPGNYTVSLSYSLPGLNEDCALPVYTLNVSVNADEPVEIHCPSVVCSGETAVYTANADCSTYQWVVSNEGTIVHQQGNSIEVLWTSPGGTFATGYVMLLPAGCSGNFCALPSVVSVPIFPTTSEISGRDAVCGSFGIYQLPLWPGAVYDWSHSVLSTYNAGSITEGGANTNRYTLNFGSQFSGEILIKVNVSHPIAGCAFTEEKAVSVFNFSIEGPGSICEGSQAEFQVPSLSGVAIDWQILAGNQIIVEHLNGGNTFTTPANLPPGEYGIAAVPEAGGASCELFRTLRVVAVSPYEMIEGPLTVCPNTAYLYRVSPFEAGVTAEWTIQQGSVTATALGLSTIVTWNPASGGPYKLSVRKIVPGSPECSSLPVEAGIAVVSPQSIEVLGDNTPCFDGTAIYSASFTGADSYFWSINPALGTIIEGQGTPVAVIRWYYTGTPATADVELSAVVCGTSVTAALQVTLSAYNLTLSGPAEVCAGSAALFTSNAGPASSYNWYVNGVLQPDLGGAPQANISFQVPGQHLVRLDAIAPSGCPGQYSAVVSINVLPNPKPAISPIEPLPCPEDTPFTRVLQAVPNGPYTYTWYRNGSVVTGGSGNTLTITATGTYHVKVDYGICSNISELFEVDYSCPCECELPSESPITVSVINAFLGAGCGTISFNGDIQPDYKDAVNPRWIISGSTGANVVIPISEELDLTQENIPAPGIGPIRIDLAAGEICGAGPEFCDESSSAFVTIPFSTDFAWAFECGASTDDFTVSLQDGSLYYEAPAQVSKVWRINGVFHSNGPNASVTVSPGAVFQVCLALESTVYGYSCEECKTLVAPEAPVADFVVDQDVMCEGEMVHFNPVLPGGHIIEYEWDFGDGTYSRLANPVKVYASGGTYEVSLRIVTSYGCERTFSRTLAVENNNLSGQIQTALMDCGASATLSFIPGQGSSSPVSYQWEPGGHSTATLSTMYSGIYRLTVTDASGCSYQPMPEQVLLVEPFPFGILGDTEDCNVVTLTIPAVSPGYTYNWSITNTGTSATHDVVNAHFVTITVPGKYIVTATAILGGQACISMELAAEVFGNPAPPVITQEVISCNPYVVLLAQNQYPEVAWTNTLWGGIPVFAPSITATEAGNQYTASYTDANGCSSSAGVTLGGIINFASFLSGCYHFCLFELTGQQLTLNGIPGFFDTWEWRRYEPGTSNYTLLTQGTGSITPLTLIPAYAGEIVLYVVSGSCSEESEPFCLEIRNDCCEDIPDVTGTKNLNCLVSDGFDEYVYWIYGTFMIPPGYTLCEGQSARPQTEIGYVNYQTFHVNPGQSRMYKYAGWFHIPAADYKTFMEEGTHFILDICAGRLVCPKKFYINPVMYMFTSNCAGAYPKVLYNPNTEVRTLEYCFAMSFVSGDECDITSYTISVYDITGGGNQLLNQTVYPYTPPLDIYRCIFVTLPASTNLLRIEMTTNCGRWCATYVEVKAIGGGQNLFGFSESCLSTQGDEATYQLAFEVAPDLEIGSYELSTPSGSIELEKSGRILYGNYVTSYPGSKFEGVLNVVNVPEEGDVAVSYEEIYNKELGNCQSLLMQNNSQQEHQHLFGTYLALFPNPATHTVTLSYGIAPSDTALNTYHMVARNTLGLTILNRPVQSSDSGNDIIDCSNWPAGVYLVSLEANGQRMVTQRLVVVGR
ncbi:MAG: PKD domain-containing protein [Saprospiraceae bacterium]|nr:PKD domain-containing protein [Saprospiraceae bacterium]